MVSWHSQFFQIAMVKMSLYSFWSMSLTFQNVIVLQLNIKFLCLLLLRNEFIKKYKVTKFQVFLIFNVKKLGEIIFRLFSVLFPLQYCVALSLTFVSIGLL